MNIDTLSKEAILADPAVSAMRAKIATIGALMYDRHLTDAAGGNLSARVKTSQGDVFCMSPRYSGSKHMWRLKPEQVLVITLDGTILDGGGEISRESRVHLRLHRDFGEHGTAVIHAHARNVLVFCAAARPMPPTLEQMRKFGTIPVIDFAPSHSESLADHVAAAITGNEARIRKQAAAVIAPWHGLFVMGKDLDAAYDAVERVDTNAYILLMSGRLGENDLLADARAALEDNMAKWESH